MITLGSMLTTGPEQLLSILQKVYLMVYWLENVYTITSMRSCQFSQGDIYRLGRTWPNMWCLAEPGKDSQGFRGENLAYLTTERSGGIFLRYRPPASPERERWRAGLSKTAMTSFRTRTTTHYGSRQHFSTIPIIIPFLKTVS
jgi:hypothetical protein